MPNRYLPVDDLEAVIFDDYGVKLDERGKILDAGDRFYLNLLKMTAEEAGYNALVFQAVSQARGHLTNTTAVFITGTGIRRKPGTNSSDSVLGDEFPAHKAIDTAHSFHVPTIVVSSHRHADELILPKNGDVVIPRDPHTKMAELLLDKLIDIRENL